MFDQIEIRCFWASQDPSLIRYHDEEWGVPCHVETGLFERLTLEVFQGGLAWRTILGKREGFRRAFEGFDFKRVALFGDSEVERLMMDAGIIRHRRKIEATVYNARVILDIQREYRSFDDFLWARVEYPEEICRDLRNRFRLVGLTVCQSFLHSVGILDGHEPVCGWSRSRG